MLYITQGCNRSLISYTINVIVRVKILTSKYYIPIPYKSNKKNLFLL